MFIHNGQKFDLIIEIFYFFIRFIEIIYNGYSKLVKKWKKGVQINTYPKGVQKRIANYVHMNTGRTFEY